MLICAVWGVARSTVYATPVAPRATPVAAAKRGPKTVTSDDAILAAIRSVLASTPFHGEGYRKVRARLAHRGLAVGGKRVLRLMRQHPLLAPRRLGPPNGDPAHAGTITTTRPDEMWGSDATRFYTEAEGWCWFFGAIDHYHDELVGWHVAKLGDRWAASSRCARVSAMLLVASPRRSPGAERFAATGGPSTSPTPGSTR
jgi:transposase InsO family protein